MTPKLSFSPSTIEALVEAVSGSTNSFSPTPLPVGRYRTAGEIARLMLQCDLDYSQGASSRTYDLRHFLHELQRTEPQKLVSVFERVCQLGDYHGDPKRQLNVLAYLNKVLKKDGYEISIHDGEPQFREVGKSLSSVSSVAKQEAVLNFNTVQQNIDRGLKNADTYPEDAVTEACSMVESVCRSILVELGLPLPASLTVDGLLRAVQDPLDLSPERTDILDEIANDLRQVLGGLTTTIKWIGALRTHGGDAHGREHGRRRVNSRIARLALHSASAAALFLIETWEGKMKRPLPRSDK